MERQCETFDVIICGCGPTGAMLSAQLGRLRVKNLVLEKEPEITTDPRGIALDEDGIRALQSVGLYGKIYTEIGQCVGITNFVSGVHHDLDRKPFLKLDYGTSEGGTGHVGMITHKQPVMEKQLRQAMQKTGFCELRTQCTIVSISEDENWVYATYMTGNGARLQVRGRYLIGSDGAKGYTRKMYLEHKGVRMEKSSGVAYEETWVAINWKISLPTPSTHPGFPLWKQGYTPEQVYNKFFPDGFRFLCNPQRFAIASRFGLSEDRLVRIEFVVHPNEDESEMANQSALEALIYPYFTRPGSQFGLVEAITYPRDCITTLRARPFRFSAKSCNRWAEGRVILCGDAAHVFPPFGGQGITSGFRDVFSLAWRLKIATGSDYKHHDAFLRAWYLERKQQLDRSLAATLENGRFVCESNTAKAFLRDWALWAMQLLPSWRRWFEQGPRKEGMIQYEYQKDLHFLPTVGAGKLLPQVYCAEISSQTETGGVSFTDDIIFADSKTGLFQLLVLVQSVEEGQSIRRELKHSSELSSDYLRAEEATFLLLYSEQPPSCQSLEGSAADMNDVGTICRLATASEFAASPLCANRPVPRYYDEHRLWREVYGHRFVILRLDRFIFATCQTVEELFGMVSKIGPLLEGKM